MRSEGSCVDSCYGVSCTAMEYETREKEMRSILKAATHGIALHFRMEAAFSRR
jgi:hypothetical protein